MSGVILNMQKGWSSDTSVKVQPAADAGAGRWRSALCLLRTNNLSGYLSRGFGDYREHRDGLINSQRWRFPLAWTSLNTRDLAFRACHFALHLPESPVSDGICWAPAELCYFTSPFSIYNFHRDSFFPHCNTGSNVLSGKHSSSN